MMPAMIGLSPEALMPTMFANSCTPGKKSGAYSVSVQFHDSDSKNTVISSVRADGSIAGGGYAALRRALLEGEGIPFTADGRVDMARCAWEILPQEVHHG